MIQAGSHIIETASIWVDREKRQRKDLGDLGPLMRSIAERGLIHPPIVTREHEIVAGERRWTAITQLGHSHIEVRYVDEVPASEIHMIELEENIRRVDISWQEQCLAMETWHRLKMEEDPLWNQAQTAEELGVSKEDVTVKLALARELATGNEKIVGVDKISTARNIMRRQTERKKQAALASLEGEKPETKKVPLLLADFHEWAAAYTGPKFNFLHCDFPYGVNANKQQQGVNVAMHGTYADSPDVYFALLDTLEMAMGNVVAEHAHLMFWFSMDFYQTTLDRLTFMGWKVNPFPLIWHKTDNTGLLPDPQRGPRRIYETAFFASRGDRLIVQAVANCVGHPGSDKEIHMSEKPEAMLRHFFRMMVDDNSTVLDPTAGSGNAIKVAQRLGASYALGLEKSEEFYNRAVAAWKDNDDEL